MSNVPTISEMGYPVWYPPFMPHVNADNSRYPAVSSLADVHTDSPDV